MTLGQWIPQYLRSYKLNTIRPDSYYTLELVVSKIPDSLRAMELCDIKPMHLQEFVNAFGCTASKSYMDKMHVMLNGLFTAAVDNELCEKNPAARLKYPRIKEQPRETFTKEEVQKILAFAMVYDKQRIGVAVMTLLLTGLRRGELLGLKETDITDNTLSVNRAVYLENHKARVIEHEAKPKAACAQCRCSLSFPIGCTICRTKASFFSVRKAVHCCTLGTLPATMMRSLCSYGKLNHPCAVFPRTAAAIPLPP